MLKNLKRYACVALVVAGLVVSYNHGYDKAETKWQKEVHSEYVRKTEANQATQREVDKVSQRYQDELAALEGSTDRVIADLRSSGKRLSVKLADTTRELSDNGGCLVDGRAELDAEFSKRLIGVTQRGDAWMRALQDTIKTLQKEKHNGDSK